MKTFFARPRRIVVLFVGVVLFTLTACAITGEDVGKLPKTERIVVVGNVAITYWHDVEHSVSCWIFQSSGSAGGGGGASISCLPDSEVNR